MDSRWSPALMPRLLESERRLSHPARRPESIDSAYSRRNPAARARSLTDHRPVSGRVDATVRPSSRQDSNVDTVSSRRRQTRPDGDGRTPVRELSCLCLPTQSPRPVTQVFAADHEELPTRARGRQRLGGDRQIVHAHWCRRPPRQQKGFDLTKPLRVIAAEIEVFLLRRSRGMTQCYKARPAVSSSAH